MGEPLTEYEGHPVLGAAVQIRNTGDGLSEAMSVAPEKLPLGSTIHVVLECEVEKHRYDPIKETNALTLVNMLKAGRATIIEHNAVTKALDAQAKEIEKAKPQQPLDLDDDVSDEEWEESAK